MLSCVLTWFVIFLLLCIIIFKINGLSLCCSSTYISSCFSHLYQFSGNILVVVMVVNFVAVAILEVMQVVVAEEVEIEVTLQQEPYLWSIGKLWWFKVSYFQTI